jgi:hypothetical protein
VELLDFVVCIVGSDCLVLVCILFLLFLSLFSRISLVLTRCFFSCSLLLLCNLFHKFCWIETYCDSSRLTANEGERKQCYYYGKCTWNKQRKTEQKKTQAKPYLHLLVILLAKITETPADSFLLKRSHKPFENFFETSDRNNRLRIAILHQQQ